MTLIAAMLTQRGVAMLGDRLTSGNDNKTILKTPKIWQRDNFLVGGAGNLAVQTVRAFVDMAPARDVPLTADWVVREWAPAARKVLTDAGLMADDEDDGRKTSACEFLLAKPGAIIRVDSAFAAVQSVYSFASIGSGGEHANAALWTLEGDESTPEERLRLAARCAAFFNTSVGEPFDCFSVDGS